MFEIQENGHERCHFVPGSLYLRCREHGQHVAQKR